jgi:hypothetical protein
MIEEITTQQTAAEATSAVPSCQMGHTVCALNGAERTSPQFNPYLYENLVSNVEVQIESWNRQAGRQSNPEAAQALRLKAEGLGYILRLLDAFQPEFRELIACASNSNAGGRAFLLRGMELQQATIHYQRKASDEREAAE